MKSSPPQAWSSFLKTSSTWASCVTSHGSTMEFGNVFASSSTFSFKRSPWYVNASVAPLAAADFATDQAILRLLATPRIRPFLPSRTGVMEASRVSAVELLDDDGRVVAAEAERVGQAGVD